jgi:hypothetical protein
VSAKQWPTSRRHSWKSAEPRKSTAWFLDRALQLEAFAALGALENGRGLGNAGFELRFQSGLDVDLCDLKNHAVCSFSCV